MPTKKKHIDTRTPEGRAIKGPRLISRNLVQHGLRDRIDGERLVDRLTDLSIKLGQYHDEGKFLENGQEKSIRLELDTITKSLSYILPTLSAQRVESSEKEGNVIESGVVMLPELDEELTEEQRGAGKKALETKGKKEE